ncbi:MAG: hypothetical protein DMD31_14320 [Gemmatimonadetes bacterium]|nr:MAG: hypothetical protein DMD31_14320 [Gemmatimonadota bacterium]
MAPAVRAWAVRHDRPLRADPPALFPFQSARLRHGLPARTLSRRGHGPLAPALPAARVARRSGAPAALAHGDAVGAVADPVSQNRPMAPAQRELTFLLADPERRLLRAIAARLPQGLTSDHLTVLGMFGALGVAAAYALSPLSPGWLWAASACLAVQWLGDSLDGTVARVRGAERPRYGYYLDHVVDAGSTALIGLGLGLSPYVNPCVALGVVIVYLALSINVYLEANVFAVFRLAYSRLGPTEVRILLIAVNAGLAVSGPGRGVYLIANATLALLGICMLGMLGVRVGQNLSRLAREEPLKRPARQLSPRGVAALS